MRVCLKTLREEMPAVAGIGVPEIRECLAMLGFPVDSVEDIGDSVVLEVDVTANRGDALSHRGLARDMAAKLGFDLSPIPVAPGAEGGATEPVEPLVPIHIETDACAAYATAVLKIDCSRLDQTPADAAAFLGAMGSNAKGLAPVDASNELLHRYGHPTHAFDADRLKGGVRIRMARAGETLLALDGAEYRLGPQDMVIADDAGPVAIAGVIGGDSTKVTDATRRVLLESAYFSPRSVTATARRLGVHTDASQRFGRGADPAFAETARDLLAQRLVSWAGAELLASWTIGRCAVERPAVPLTEKTLRRIAGEPIGTDEAAAILERLGCAAERTGDGLSVRPPSWRHDLCIEEDFAEEVLRVRGFDKLGSALPPLDGAPEPLPESYLQRRTVSRRLAQLGFYQTVTLGFVGPEVDAGSAKNPTQGRTLRNPLGTEYGIMRSSLLPSLRGAAEANQRNGAKDIRLFEIAPVYESAPDGPVETSKLALVWAGALGGEDPLSPARAVMTADLIAVAKDLGLGGDLEIAELGQNAFGLEVPMSGLPGAGERTIPLFRPFSRYPVITRDISLLAPLGLRYGYLDASIKNALKDAPLTSVACTDVFKDAKLTAEGTQAWLIRLRFQAQDRTLTGEEVESWVAAAIAAAAPHGASLRG
jgi:phenylalanyl-tRNA synthetase beta chain